MSVDLNEVAKVAQERLLREEKPIYPNTLFVRKDDAAETKARIDAEYAAAKVSTRTGSEAPGPLGASTSDQIQTGQLVGQALRQLYRDRLASLRRQRADFLRSADRCACQIEELERLVELTLG